jgi:hypothetical protein
MFLQNYKNTLNNNLPKYFNFLDKRIWLQIFQLLFLYCTTFQRCLSKTNKIFYMKKSRLIAIFLLLGVFGFGLNWAISNGERSDRETRNKVDTRIDNLNYWVDMARKGYIEFNPEMKTEPAIYTGSKIKAFGVIMEDSPDVPVTEINSTQSENSVFVDPSNSDILLNSNNSTPNPVAGIYGANDLYSFDAAETWEGEVQGAGGSNSGDPTTAIGNNGRWYVNYIASSYGMGISYSDDQGASWTTGTVAPNPGDLADKNHMWIDNSLSSSYEGNLYVAWTNFGGPSHYEIAISYSDDDGLTWNANNDISSAVNAGSHNQGVNIGTGPDGEVYAVWAIYDGWPTDETAIGILNVTSASIVAPDINATKPTKAKPIWIMTNAMNKLFRTLLVNGCLYIVTPNLQRANISIIPTTSIQRRE